MEMKAIETACHNVLLKIRCRPKDNIFIIFDNEKKKLAYTLKEIIILNKANPYLVELPIPFGSQFCSLFSKFFAEIVKHKPSCVFLSHSMIKSKKIIKVIGRPDQGIGDTSSRFFCDWGIPIDSFIRLYSTELSELERYRKALLRELRKGKNVEVITELGTNITLQTRDWLQCDGEVFTAPIEDSVNGKIVFDASIYWKPPDSPIIVKIETGEIKEIYTAQQNSEQYKMFIEDSKKDKGASTIAELGIGINLNANPHGHNMEAEQARNTCHFDFGNNIPFHGNNYSSIHHGGTVWKPTIKINGRVVINEGEPVFKF